MQGEIDRLCGQLDRDTGGPADVPEVTADDIAEVVSRATGIPVSQLTEEERERLLKLEEHLHRQVVGQDEALIAVAEAVRRARAGLADPNRPIGSSLFLGPTGVGKTELARALAEALFGDEDRMVRFDMSEFQERHTVSRLAHDRVSPRRRQAARLAVSRVVASRQRPRSTTMPSRASSTSSPQLRKLNTWTCSPVGCGIRPSWISIHWTGVAVSSSVSHTAMPLDASHSPCSSETTRYQPTTVPVIRNLPRPAAARNSTPPRVAVHSPWPTGVRTPRRTWVSTTFSSDRPFMVNSALNA